MKDKDGKYNFINESFEKTFNIRLAESSRDVDILPPEIIEKVRADDQKVLETGETIESIVIIPAPNGEQNFWQNFKFPVTDRFGKKFVGGIAVNINETKRLEAELEEARDIAVESARLKSEFLANMSHEIRTPMNGVIGMAELLMETGLTDEQRDYAQTIQTSGATLLNIINDILDFSKIEAGKLHFETVDFNIEYVLDSVVELFSETVRNKKLELASILFNSVPRNLRGDPGRLRQILTNLVGNAVKFTKAGEIVISIKLEKSTATHSVLRFSVTDTGAGIPAEFQGRLFQAFTQADGLITRQFGGTGLGLTISKQLVLMMNGDIGVESEVGKGSTFWFTAAFENQSAEKSANVVQRDLHNLRILVVDDNETNRKVLKQQTTGWKMLAEEAASGEIALEKLRRAAAAGHPFDIAVLDLLMPEMDGFALAEQIKTDETIKQTRLILMPSFGQRGHARRAREIGIDAYLVKPIRQSEFYNCLANISNLIAAVPPQKKTAAPPREQLVTRHSLKETADYEKSNQRILVAEDNAVNQKVVLRQIEKLGFPADLVGNGQEAVEAVKKGNYSLILMDCQMPVTDGFTATTEIRRLEESGHIPIIALTAHAIEGDREKCLAAGMDDYISKPTTQAALGAAINLWLKNSAAADGKAAPPEITAAESSASVRHDVSLRLSLLRDDCGADEVTAFIDLFLHDAEERLKRMTDLMVQGKFAELKIEVHGLKGSAANMGAKQISAFCRRMEQEITGENLAAVEKVLIDIKDLFKRLKPHYHAEKNPTQTSRR
ncbi:MAG: response regulator [Pyrinomonadaceae bacterium]